jgi:von Willebrand factor type A domain
MTHASRTARGRIALAAAAAVCCGAAGVPRAQADELRRTPPVRSSIVMNLETPVDGGVVGDPGGLAFVSGKALASYGEFERFDIVFVIDQSESTSSSSGGDVNGDGVIDRGCGGPAVLGFFGEMVGACGNSKDSILSAELAAARILLRQLDPRTTQVAVVSFSGDGRNSTPDASVMAPLTPNFRQVEVALERIEAMGPRGSTNMEAGVKVAALELIGSQAAFSNVRERPQQIILFMSDGLPTLPIVQSIRKNRRVALEAALTAGKFEIRLDTYGIGDEALSQPVTLVDMARVTKGIFTPVADPRDLTLLFQQLDFSDVEDLEITNLTNQKPAAYLLRNADGTFGALLEMQEGSNTIEVFARALDGSEERRRLNVQFVKDAKAPPLPLPLVAQRNRLMENRLLDLRTRPSPRDEELRKALKLRIEAARKRALDRARSVRIEEEGSEPADPGKDKE